MRAFEFTNPKQKQQVVSLLGKQWGDAEILAGGSDLLGLMKDEVVHPKRLVNVKGIQELQGISFSESRGLRIGALTTLVEISEHAQVNQRYSMLAHAARDAASPQIRNVATIGGNMCQRPRCWWFRNGFGLLAIGPNGKSLVLEGDNRHHAILGNDGPAYFVSPSTVAPVLIAYNAKIRLFGPTGQRDIPLEKFFVIPKTQEEREHDLRPNEVVTDILVPAPAAGIKASHYEVRQKEAFDWPYATASVVLDMNGDTVRSARVVMSHVAPIPWVSNEAGQALAGKMISEETADAAGAAAVANAKNLGRNKHKIKLARVAVKRAILQATKGERA
ncbi:MAG TPA: FAD binding domain-containing protein [Terriglobales bacterium]|nr:FAD binding domain-containing protein [Terriglobales bacterium]